MITIKLMIIVIALKITFGSCNDVNNKLDVLLVLRCESCLTTSRGSGARLTLALALWDG